jgi:hypothetical protein
MIARSRRSNWASISIYCSELLSLIGKISALYSQSLDDPVVLKCRG